MSELQKIFEHTIDLSGRLEKEVGQNDIYSGLLDFVYRPERYIEALESSQVAAIDQADGGVLVRRLDFGNFQVKDHVTLVPGKKITFSVAASQGIPESKFSIALEQPENNGVLLRFTYHEVANPEMAGQEFLQSLRNDAWRTKDVAVVDAILARLGL